MLATRVFSTFFAFSAIVLAAPAAAGVNEWTTAGPFVYAGTRGGGVFKSGDRAATWAPASRSLPFASSVSALAIDPSAPATLYAALVDGGVYKSLDRGRRWRASGSGLPEPAGSDFSPRAGGLAIDPTNPSTVYFDHRREGLFRSTDGGATWSPVLVLAATDVRAVGVDPRSTSTLYVAASEGVFRSVDGAASWSALGGGLPERAWSGVW